MSALSKPPGLNLDTDLGEGEICQRVAAFAQREAEQLGSRRFFARVAEATGHRGGAELARELASHLGESWARDNIERGLDLFHHCVDETGERCVAALVAEYLSWREPPDSFFHRAGALLSRRSASELVRLARILGAYARLAKPHDHELRMLAAVPNGSLGDPLPSPPTLAVVAFVREGSQALPPHESNRIATELASLGNEMLVVALANAEFAWLAEPGPVAVPLVGRPLLWFPISLDADLRRLHLLFASAIR
ncbi:hypothetical protein ACNOYE_22435 [Nannocystaceae bacterium ST9]